MEPGVTGLEHDQDHSTTTIFGRAVVLKFLGPQHNHTIWSCSGPEISGPQHDVGKYYGRALVLRHQEPQWNCTPNPDPPLVSPTRARVFQELASARPGPTRGGSAAQCAV